MPEGDLAHLKDHMINDIGFLYDQCRTEVMKTMECGMY